MSCIREVNSPKRLRPHTDPNPFFRHKYARHPCPEMVTKKSRKKRNATRPTTGATTMNPKHASPNWPKLTWQPDDRRRSNGCLVLVPQHRSRHWRDYLWMSPMPKFNMNPKITPTTTKCKPQRSSLTCDNFLNRTQQRTRKLPQTQQLNIHNTQETTFKTLTYTRQTQTRLDTRTIGLLTLRNMRLQT